MRKIFLLLLLFVSFEVYAQDIEAITKAKPVKISGGLGTDHVFYHSDGIADRRNSPYQYYFNGSLNFLFFGEFSVPLSFSYSNQRFNYAQPFNQQRFNQFGISPKYRWITGHFGWRNMTFSPYSLNGHLFSGGGVELSPGKFQVAAMYGRLLKEVELDTSAAAGANRASYRRMGMGLNVKYEDQGNGYGFSIFRSADQSSSLDIPLDSVGITPEENFVYGLTIKQKLSPKLQLDGEVAVSTITKDSRPEDGVKAQRTLGIIEENGTTTNYTAYKAAISYSLKKSKIGFGYERIAPGYRTHGAYYFNNDLENITVNYSTTLFKNKVSLGANAGKQRNNLDDSKISTMKRWVGALNINWQVSEKINVGINYSNFQTYTNMRSQFTLLNSTNPYEFIDTLNYVQISQSVNFNANYTISSNEKRQQSLSLNAMVQTAAEEQGGKQLATGSDFYNANIAYMYAIVPLNLSFNLAGNGNWNRGIASDSKIFGPTAGIGKSFFQKKLMTNLSYSWNTTINNDVSTGYVGSLRLTNTLMVKKSHNFTMSFVWLNRESKATQALQTSFNEFTGRIGYNFRF